MSSIGNTNFPLKKEIANHLCECGEKFAPFAQSALNGMQIAVFSVKANTENAVFPSIRDLAYNLQKEEARQ